MQSEEREDWIGHEADGPSDTVIGRYFVDYDDRHSNVIMDELANVEPRPLGSRSSSNL